MPLWLRRGAVLVGLIGLALTRFIDPEPLSTLRSAFFDLEQRLFRHTGVRSRVTVVEIDEASIAALGQWPWPRNVMADLVSRLARHKPAVLGIDLIFSEPDRSSPEHILRRLPADSPARETLAAMPSHDAILAEKLRQAPTVLAVAVVAGGPRPSGPARSRAPRALRYGPQDLHPGLRRYPGLLTNLEMFEKASKGTGIASVELDHDGVVRRLPALMLVDDVVIPGFAVEMLRIALGAGTMIMKFDDRGVATVSIGGHAITTDSSGYVWLRYVPRSVFPRLSVADVLAGRYDPETIRNRLVLIGSTSTGIRGAFAVPTGEALSALDLQAQFVENLLSQIYLEGPRLAPAAEAMAALIICLCVVAFRSRLRGYAGQIAILAVASGLFGASLYAFSQYRVLIDPTFAVASMLVTYLVLVGAGIVEAQRERRRSEAERETALVLAEAANRTKTHFLANMSHELRTPLNLIIGFSEMMKDGVFGPVSPPKYDEYANDIHRMGSHLIGIVNQVLEMAKVESGESRLDETEFDVRDALNTGIRTVRSARRNTGVKIRLDGAARLPRLWADRRMVTEMVKNLVSNAVKFSPSGGVVRVLGGLSDLDELRLSVSDTGAGMDEEEVAEALTPFRSVDHDLASESGGIGLGLPLTKAMIEMHGGRLELSGATGQGTVATLIFPPDRVRGRNGGRSRRHSDI